MTCALVIAIICANVAGNILIKKGAIHKGNIFINKYTPCGYILFAVVMIISLKLITAIELKYFSMIMAINYFATYLAGIIVFKEKNNKWGMAGIIAVCIGVVIFNLPEST